MFFVKQILCTQRRHCSQNHNKIQILKNAFGMTYPEANIFLRKIKQRDPDKFLGCINVCRNLGFSDDEILEHPGLLNGLPIVLEQHFMTLEEGGFQKITPYILLKYRTYFSKSIVQLKQETLIPYNLSVAQSFGKYFDPNPEAGVIDYNHFSDDERWRDVHQRLLKLYLRWRLEATPEEIEVLFRIHHMVKNKSVRLLCENIQLALDVGLSLKRIIKSGYILHAYPKYTKEVLRDFQNIAGGNLREAMIGCPKLLMVSPKNYAKIYGILKEHQISDEAIRNQLNIFQLSPQTIKYRLEEIDKTPELKILKHHYKILKLVVHHQRAKSRLCFLQELQMKCLPLKILSQDHSIDTHVRNARDVNDPKEVIIFMKMLLNVEEKYFEKYLTKHPFYNAVPFPQLQDTYNYLCSIKFRNNAICKVPSILLYPKEKVKEALREVKKNIPSNKLPISQAQRLNLVLYYLEKKHHFSGNGIWPETTKDIDLH